MIAADEWHALSLDAVAAELSKHAQTEHYWRGRLGEYLPGGRFAAVDPRAHWSNLRVISWILSERSRLAGQAPRREVLPPCCAGGCTNMAEWVAYWPTEALNVCADHVVRAFRMARVLKLALIVGPYTADVLDGPVNL